jgi:hypothetical protein
MDAKTRLFWTKVDIRSGDECWEWKACKNAKGYGKFAVGDGKWVLAPRFVMKALADKFVLHSCDNPACCNPAHLRLGTAADNTQDMLERGRANPSRGAANGKAKLTEQQVQRIRIVGEALPKRRLAALYGVTDVLIGKIIRRELWQHLA